MIGYDARYTFGTWHVDTWWEWVLYPISMVLPFVLLILCVGFMAAIVMTEGTDRDLDVRAVLKGCALFSICALFALAIASLGS